MMQLINVAVLLFLLFVSINITTQNEQAIEHIKKQIIEQGIRSINMSEPNVNFAFNVFHMYVSCGQFYKASDGYLRLILETILGFRNNSESSTNLRSLDELTERIEKSTGLRLENTIFLHNNDSLDNSLLEHMKASFNANIINLDSGISQQEAANIINRFVANKTKNLTAPLLVEPIFNSTKTTLVSISRIETLWDSIYKSSNTIDVPFYAPGENITVQMIKLRENACYKETPSFRTAKIRISKSISLGIAMKNNKEKDDVSDLKEFEKIITQPCDRILLNIQLPRIVLNFDTTYGISGFLQFFPNEIDLTNTGSVEHPMNSRFYSTSASQLNEAHISFLRPLSSNSHNRLRRSTDEVQFVIDKPFYFWLSDSETETVLFLGKVNNPNLKK